MKEREIESEREKREGIEMKMQCESDLPEMRNVRARASKATYE
jgi:hypothetical protein